MHCNRTLGDVICNAPPAAVALGIAGLLLAFGQVTEQPKPKASGRRKSRRKTQCVTICIHEGVLRNLRPSMKDRRRLIDSSAR